MRHILAAFETHISAASVCVNEHIKVERITPFHPNVLIVYWEYLWELSPCGLILEMN